eukprot:COSAG06_NODE_51111_length_314_cov_0.734884_1_plen_38_part_10
MKVENAAYASQSKGLCAFVFPFQYTIRIHPARTIDAPA